MGEIIRSDRSNVKPVEVDDVEGHKFVPQGDDAELAARGVVANPVEDTPAKDEAEV